MIFVIYYKGGKKVGGRYLCHLTFILSKFTLKNFIFLEMVYDTIVSPNIFKFFFIFGICCDSCNNDNKIQRKKIRI